MAKIVKATPEQKAEYKGICPLYGYVTHNGITAIIEHQTDEPEENEIKYYIEAPEGYRFRGYMSRGKHAKTLAEIKFFATYLEAGQPQ